MLVVVLSMMALMLALFVVILLAVAMLVAILSKIAVLVCVCDSGAAAGVDGAVLMVVVEAVAADIAWLNLSSTAILMCCWLPAALHGLGMCLRRRGWTRTAFGERSTSVLPADHFRR